MPLGFRIKLTVEYDRSTYSPTPTSDHAAVRALKAYPYPTWILTPWGESEDGEPLWVLSIDDQFLSTRLVVPNCLSTTPDYAQAAEMLMLESRGEGVCFKLVDTDTVLTLDLRTFVTQFRPQQPENGYPYFQYFDRVSVGPASAGDERPAEPTAESAS